MKEIYGRTITVMHVQVSKEAMGYVSMEEIMAKIPEEKAEATRAEKVQRLTKEAGEYLKANQKHYQEVLEDIDQTVKQIFSEKKGWTVHGRVKSAGSLQEKILRKGYYKNYENGAMIIENLPDLIGVRIQCLLNQEEKIAYEMLQEKRISMEESGCSVYQTVNGVKMVLLLQNQPEKQKMVMIFIGLREDTTKQSKVSRFTLRCRLNPWFIPFGENWNIPCSIRIMTTLYRRKS